MRKISLYFTVGIVLCLFGENTFSQDFNNKSAEDFGVSIFHSIKNNDFNDFIKYLPVNGDSFSYIDDNKIEQEIVITNDMINQIREKLKFSFQNLQNEFKQEKEKQNIDNSKVFLYKITTELEVANNKVVRNVGIEIFLDIKVGTTKYTIRIEDNIKTNNGYFLFDNLKIKLKEENFF